MYYFVLKTNTWLSKKECLSSCFWRLLRVTNGDMITNCPSNTFWSRWSASESSVWILLASRLIILLLRVVRSVFQLITLFDLFKILQRLRCCLFYLCRSLSLKRWRHTGINRNAVLFPTGQILSSYHSCALPMSVAAIKSALGWKCGHLFVLDTF